ncbi:MAG: dihydroxyacetone kinase subunit DhaK [Aquamicrobium sp.]|uniref:dihydroxyacetone kinase subunit DhaK n=1 Tax=Aquamicrobium sp. TaxID=1872579 RepID=UPI00349EFD3C|nr:dihydroxyacetone kinase subunit DhaK [Aquamicrobium sp.]
MKKLINDVATVLDESLDGFAAAHAELIEMDTERRFVRRRAAAPGKVALVSGGGSGHEPLHAGFVGQGMLDAAVPGAIFTSPTPDRILAAIEAVDAGAGVLLIVKNYEGDVMNFEMAAEMATGRVASVLVDDDVAVDNSSYSIGRRGVAGTLVVEKILGAAAEQGMGLDALTALAGRVSAATRSMGVALSSCTVPAAGKPTFELGEDEIEIGVGIHGEPGRRRGPMAPAATIVNELLDAILADLKPAAGARCLLFVNGFGGTPSGELYLVYDAARRRLAKEGLDVARSLVGTYVTSLEMAGCSLTVTVLDDELAALWDAPVRTPALCW